MAAPRYGHWVNDMAPGRRGPSTFGALALFVVAGLLLYALLAGPTATAEGGRSVPPTTPPACAQHWPPTCKEASHGR